MCGILMVVLTACNSGGGDGGTTPSPTNFYLNVPSVVTVGQSGAAHLCTPDGAETKNLTINIASSNNNIAIVNPGSTTVDTTNPCSSFTVTGVSAGSATITVSAAGYGSQSADVAVVNP